MLNTGTANHYILIAFFDSYEKYVFKCDSNSFLCKSCNKPIILFQIILKIG